MRPHLDLQKQNTIRCSALSRKLLSSSSIKQRSYYPQTFLSLYCCMSVTYTRCVRSCCGWLAGSIGGCEVDWWSISAVWWWGSMQTRNHRTCHGSPQRATDWMDQFTDSFYRFDSLLLGENIVTRKKSRVSLAPHGHGPASQRPQPHGRPTT